MSGGAIVAVWAVGPRGTRVGSLLRTKKHSKLVVNNQPMSGLRNCGERANTQLTVFKEDSPARITQSRNHSNEG